MIDRITITIADHVADVRLARPDKMNALDPAMFDALAAAGERLRAHRDVRAIVLSGEGKAFCAGLDLANFGRIAREGAPADFVERTHGAANLAQHVVLQWRDMPVPVIAAVHGVAFGAGFQLMLGADLRFARPDAKLSAMEVKWGLVPDMAGMLLLRELVRPDIAADLIYTGRVFDGAEATALGLVTRLSDEPFSDALEAAHAIAAKSPAAIRAAKRLLAISDDELARRVLAAETAEQAALMGTPDQGEAVRAAMEKRVPVFADRGAGPSH